MVGEAGREGCVGEGKEEGKGPLEWASGVKGGENLVRPPPPFPHVSVASGRL